MTVVVLDQSRSIVILPPDGGTSLFDGIATLDTGTVDFSGLGTVGSPLIGNVDASVATAASVTAEAAARIAGDALLTAHIADVADAHAASAITFTPTGTIAATDVQAAIAEVAAEVYTDEAVQDSVGSILVDSATLDFTYDDAVPSITGVVKPDSITPTEIAVLGVDFGATINTIPSVLSITTREDHGGLVLKGHEASQGAGEPYGTENAWSVHAFGAGDVDTVMRARCDFDGLMGAVAMHLAPGQNGSTITPTQLLWLDSGKNSALLVGDNPTVAESATWTQPYFLFRDLRVDPVVNVIEGDSTGLLTTRRGILGVSTPGGAFGTVAALTARAAPGITSVYGFGLAVEDEAGLLKGGFTGGGMLLAGVGTAAGPSLTSLTWPDTGIFFPVDEEIGFTDGVEFARMKALGLALGGFVTSNGRLQVSTGAATQNVLEGFLSAAHSADAVAFYKPGLVKALTFPALQAGDALGVLLWNSAGTTGVIGLSGGDAPLFGTRAAFLAGAPGNIPAVFTGHADQTAALLVLQRAATIGFFFDKDGYPVNCRASVPADGVVAASQRTGWLDATNGAAKDMVKAKQADGTVVSGGMRLTAAGVTAALYDRQQFTASGTWTKPSWVTSTTRWRAVMRGASGGGGSGRKGAAATVRCGGGGGAGGLAVEAEYLASELPATLGVTVGAAGVGGASQTTNSTDGNPGTAGGVTFIGDTQAGALLTATGGGGGGAGTATTGTAGTGVASMSNSGAAASTTGLLGATGPGFGVGAIPLTCGGGSGAGIDTSDNTSAGGAGGVPAARSGATAAAGGTSGGGAGGNGVMPASTVNSPSAIGGSGGGGGSRKTAGGSGGAGGNGAGGSGGGGGGAAANAADGSGKGGDGIGGVVIVICEG